MWNALRLTIICFITYNAVTDPTVHERLPVIILFAALVAHGTVWLLRRGFYLLRLVLLKLRV